MAIQYQTANQILNQTAAEVGLVPTADPYSSTDDGFRQLRYLLNSSGQRLASEYDWEQNTRQYTFVTDDRAVQDYPLPNDFGYMIDQTGWMRDQNVPLSGPLSPQDWQLLLGRDLVSTTIYASFRLNQGLLRLFPNSDIMQSPETIAYEYMSINWVQPNGEQNRDNFKNEVSAGTDIVLYPTPLAMLYLKARFLGAKGMDTAKADAEFSQSYLLWSGHDKSAPILNPARARHGVPWLDMWRNVPDTHFGGVY